ncbi:MAG: Zn-dependent exopeptidase M28 [Solirubrobacteraceae bacterium]|nr:Zn-dependent exopeptidase M28 [Solirubrobacteraceae bacterium]
MFSSQGNSEDEPARLSYRVLVIVLIAQFIIGAALLTWVAIGRPVPGMAKETKSSAPTSLAPRATVDRFDGRRAFRLLERQVKVYGPRPAGSDASRRLGDDLVKRLPNGTFEEVPGGLRNIVGTLPGSGVPIVVGAHYDTEATIPGHVGANDGAAGTAAVVELARALGKTDRGPDAPPIRFVLFDGEEEPAGAEDEPFEEVALRGSKVEAARDPKPQAMILLDYIAERRGLQFPREGHSDERLWKRLRASSRKVGTAALFPNTSTYPIIDDHIPFIRQGVPSIDLIDFDYPQRDSVRDNLDRVSERSLDAVGETVLQLLRTW